MGLDPNVPSAIPASLLVNGNQLEYTYTLSKSAAGSLSIQVEYCDSLMAGDWTQTALSGTSTPITTTELTETFKVTVPAGDTKRFVRLKVATPSP